MMAVNLDQQYMPIATTQTAANDAVSVRQVRDLANSLNNFKAHFGCALIGECYPKESGGVSSVVTPTNDASHAVLRYYASRFIGQGYNAIRVSACGKVTSNPGGGASVTFKLYAMTSLPKHVIGTVQSGQLDHATSCSLTFTDDTAYAWKHTTLSLPIGVDGRQDFVYFLLTGQNSTAAASFNAWLTNLTATPYYG